MFIGRPPGNYDRLLDFSRAVTGNLFFVPSATFLDNVGTTRRRPTRAFGHAGRGATAATDNATVRSASAHSKETPNMNNLHRELAPISDAAWAQIEEETTRRSSATSPAGGSWMCRARRASPLRRRHRPPADDRDARDGILARQREVKALVELRVPFELDRQADRRRGARRR